MSRYTHILSLNHREAGDYADDVLVLYGSDDESVRGSLNKMKELQESQDWN